MGLQHNIMNIKVGSSVKFEMSHDDYLCYKEGYRDARHEAASLAVKSQALIEELFEALCDRHADDLVDELKEKYNL